MTRPQLKRKKAKPVGGNFIKRDEEPPIEFFSSGCTLLDCALGGGWAVNRCSQVFGDSSTGKSLLCIEAMVNFRLRYPEAVPVYIETEEAFNPDYANVIGLAPGSFELISDEINTVEDLCDYIEKLCEERDESSAPNLIIVDSLDSLTTRAELKRKMGEATMGMEKPKLLSEFFRRQVRKISACNLTLLLVSQVRSNIGGGPFAPQTITSGGKGIKFYMSQQLQLTQIGKIKATAKKVERVVGIDVRAQVLKNRLGPSFRQLDFPILFSYGIDDVTASLGFLVKAEMGDLVDLPKNTLVAANSWKKELEKLTDDRYRSKAAKLRKAVRKAWRTIEKRFKPTRQKYS